MNDAVFAGPTPWQQWGNTQAISAPPNTFTDPNVSEQKITLCRVGYGRPDTWRFLLAAKLISAPATAIGEQASVALWFELMTGIGRSSVIIPFWASLPGWQWNFGAAVPVNVLDWTNWTSGSNQGRVLTDPFNTVSDEVPPVTTAFPQISSSFTIPTDTVIGQDMTLVAHVNFVTDIVGVTQPAVVEVSGYFSPNTHVRPDWMQIDADPRAQFPGGEVGGR